MNKKELIDSMAAESDMSQKDTKVVLEAFLNTVTQELSTGGTVQLVGFGTFKIGHRSERQGRNPKTGEALTIKAANVVSFSAGAGLKNSIN